LKLPGSGGVLYLMAVIDKAYVASMVDKEIHSRLRHCATSPKVVGSIPDGVIEFLMT